MPIDTAPVEAFNEAVLHGLAWGDVVPVNLACLLPLQDRIAGQLCPVVHCPAGYREAMSREGLTTM